MEKNEHEIKSAQLATAIDAEGNVGIYKQSQRRYKTDMKRYFFTPTIVLTNTSYEWLNYFKEFVGCGTLGASSKTTTGKTLYKLTWRCRQAERIAKMVKNRIIIKRQRIQDIIDWYDGAWRNNLKRVPNKLAEQFLSEKGY